MKANLAKKLRLFYCNWIQKHFVLCKAKAYWKLWIHLVWHAALCVPLKSHTRNISVKLSIHLILQKTFSALLLNNMLIFSWWDWKNILFNIVVHVILYFSDSQRLKCANSFLHIRLVSVCYLSMFFCKQKSPQKSDLSFGWRAGTFTSTPRNKQCFAKSI